MGPIQLIPHHGAGWAQEKLCERLRATYSKQNGVRYLFGAYDVHADCLHGRLRAHKNGSSDPATRSGSLIPIGATANRGRVALGL